MSAHGLLFDLDGTLINSDPLHLLAFQEIMAEFGREMPQEEYHLHVMGKHNTEILSRYFPGEEAEHQYVVDRKEARFLEKLGNSAPPVTGLLEVLDWANSSDIRLAVVTNAPRGNAEAMLAAIGLTHRFEVVVIGDECERAKPDPMPYQIAMRRLGVTPSHAIAFEDSPSGLRAARGSGAHVFGLTTSLAPATLINAGAHQTIADYTDPALWERLRALKDS